MIAWGSIAEAAVTEGRRPSTGVDIIIFPVVISLAAVLPIIEAGATVDLPLTTLAVSGVSPAIGVGVAIDVAPMPAIVVTTATTIAGAGATVDTPLAAIGLSPQPSSVVAGATVTLPPVPVEVAAGLLAAGTGVFVDIAVVAVGVLPQALVSTSGATVNALAPHLYATDFSIAGGALTELPQSYMAYGPVSVLVEIKTPGVGSGATVDLSFVGVAMQPLPIEIIARPRAVRALAIAN